VRVGILLLTQLYMRVGILLLTQLCKMPTLIYTM
jgi:hypothetical protein